MVGNWASRRSVWPAISTRGRVSWYEEVSEV